MSFRGWAADAARWTFWVGLRPLIREDRPARSAVASAALARGQGALSPRRGAVMEEELARCFPSLRGRALRDAVREGWSLGAEALVDELLLGRLSEAGVDRRMRFDGRERLDRALAAGRGAVLVYPHAGAVMLMIARLAGYDYAQVALRGFPPEERRLTSDLRPTPLNLAARRARDAAEDALSVEFLPVEGGARGLLRVLERGGLLGVALDGRGGRRFERVAWLGRPANLSTGAVRLAGLAGAPLVPALPLRDRRGPWRLWIGEPVDPRDPAAQALVLAQLEPLLSAQPALYGRWLLHCRERAAADAHPLFADYPSPSPR
ncbi:MAG: lysophospholipid acyltransferase family protein [Deltaproteobacteria bacterium]|nr:lysophospholipid acyltransferase family protein [Deltaproteobacteria bacterium]